MSLRNAIPEPFPTKVHEHAICEGIDDFSTICCLTLRQPYDSTAITVEVVLTSRKVVVLFAPTEATAVNIPPSTVAVMGKRERRKEENTLK